uniref:HAT C-terminal dimerisation domain-containing protein n=1 Tax=Globisporangium ultimum (strain ATCC 200006 / CBS 805.95 / DAOM BR144) TaxID=431595 RepID=K3X3L3_GLOUD
MQMMFHPLFKCMKGLSTSVQLCNSQLGATRGAIERIEIAVKDVVKLRLQTTLQLLTIGSLPAAFSDELTELFGSALTPVASAPTRLNQVEEELKRWLDDPSPLLRDSDNKAESLLSFWRRQVTEENYKFLSKAARIILAISVSSAQIERDFGVSGMMVTAQRSCLSAHNIGMWS